jgi:hypothetical protein
MVVGIAAAGLLAGATVVLASEFGTDGVFHACVSTKDGDLRLVEDGQSCENKEVAVAWTSGDTVIASRWYRDADADGFGDWYESVDSPAQPDGYVDNNDDCDDSSADTYPGRPDDPGGHTDGPFSYGDRDCDGVAGDDRLVNWYVDADGDGYGLAGTEIQAPRSSAPAGRVRSPGDCDDAEATIGPYSAACGGTVDFDGDGSDASILGGDDCDDFDMGRYLGNAEVNDGFGHDEDCDPLSGAVPAYDPLFYDPRPHSAGEPQPQVD